MPIVEVEGQQFEFPEGTPDTVISNAIRQHFGEDQAQQVPQELPEGSALDVVLEPAQAIASGLVGQIGSGIAGAVTAPFAGAEKATEVIGGIQQAAGEFGAPETQRGQEALQTVGDLMEKGIDIARIPISGLAGIAELISGQGVEQAAETVRSVQEKGVGQTAGDRAFEITGDPLIAAVATTTPEIVGSIFPVAKIAQRRSALKTKLGDQVKAASAQPELANELRLISSNAKTGAINEPAIINSLSRLEVDARNKAGSIVANKIANISEEVKKGNINAINQLDDIAEEAATAVPQKSLVKYTIDGAGKVKADKLAQETIKQGFDSGTIAAVSGASRADKMKMSKMVDVMQKGKENALFAMKNRPSDIAGDSLLGRINHVKSVNKTAGKQLDNVAKSLKGQQVDSTQSVNNFLSNLDEMGVRLDNRLRPNFKGSDIEGLAGPQSAIASMVKRLSSGRKGVQPDAYELHRMKRFIDENVTYGKAGEGLKGKTERVLKQLRADIDNTLDTNFPDYDAVNTTYADTVGALDNLQDAVGKKMDLFGPNADKATGTVLRRMMSNAQSRVNLVDSVDQLESTARKYGGVFDDDIATQMLFTDELDMVFGPVARTSLAGETAKGVKKAAETAVGQRTILGTATEIGSAAAETYSTNDPAVR
jgi:hypothetical protein